MKIGELGARTGCPADTIRFYEAEGLLQVPMRAANNYRDMESRRSAASTSCGDAAHWNMGHDEIGALLRLQDDPRTACDDVKGLLDAHTGHVDARIAELQALKTQTQQIRDACADGECIGACGALQSLKPLNVVEPAQRMANVAFGLGGVSPISKANVGGRRNLPLRACRVGRLLRAET